jgi:hypothetical protein
MECALAAHCGRRGFGKSEEEHLAVVDESSHRTYRLFDGNIDFLNAQPPEAGPASPLYVLRTPFTPKNLPSGDRTFPNLVAKTTSCRRPRITRPTNSSFRPTPNMSAASKKNYSQVDGAMYGGDGLAFVRRTIKLRHTHAAQAEPSDSQFARAQAALRHVHKLLGFRCGHKFRRAPLLDSG